MMFEQLAKSFHSREGHSVCGLNSDFIRTQNKVIL